MSDSAGKSRAPRHATSQQEWERAYDEAMQSRDWQTCDQLLAERDAESRVRCPWCCRGVETCMRDGERVMLGHRVEREHTTETPWCQGGGRHVAGT